MTRSTSTVTDPAPARPDADPAQTEAFAGKALEDLSAAMTTFLAVLGDRLGLFKDLAAHGPATGEELARRAGVDPRYAEEWLGGMTTAGYLTHDADTGRFTLPPRHIPVLAQEGGPFFFGGVYQEMWGVVKPLEQIMEAFRNGGGVPSSAYDEDFWGGLERFTGGWYKNFLVQEWIPAVPDVERKLKEGARMADVGCGRGRAIITLAQAFPKSRFVGYDLLDKNLAGARESAEAAGVADRVSFERVDAAGGLPGPFDIVTTFDVVHDAADPPALLRSIHSALEPDGSYLMLEVNCSDTLEGNAGPLGALFHGFSVFHCMTTSLADGGAGLGTLGMHEPNVRKLCEQAGFQSIDRLPLEDPFNAIYAIRP